MDKLSDVGLFHREDTIFQVTFFSLSYIHPHIHLNLFLLSGIITYQGISPLVQSSPRGKRKKKRNPCQAD